MSIRIVLRQTTYWDFASPDGVERIHFIGKQEHSFVAPECDRVEICSAHPVLVDYQQPWSSIYISSSAPSAEAVLEELCVVVASALGPWRTAQSYLNDLMDPVELLRGGSGLLAHAPQPVADLFCATLKRFDVSHSVLPPRGVLDPMQALIAGQNFVVASGFRRERGPNNSSKPTPLRGAA